MARLTFVSRSEELPCPTEVQGAVVEGGGAYNGFGAGLRCWDLPGAASPSPLCSLAPCTNSSFVCGSMLRGQ